MGRLIQTKKVFFEFLSLGSPKAVVIVFSILILMLGIIPTAFFGEKGGICIWHQYILPLILGGNCPESGFFAHCYCPACGLTHAFSRFFHADLKGAREYNKSIFAVATVVFAIYITNIIKFIKNRSH